MTVLLADNALEEPECVDGLTYRVSRFKPASIEANAAKAVSSFEDEHSENWLLLAETEVEQEQEKRGGANYYCTVSPTGTTLIIRNNIVVGGSIRPASDAGISGGLTVGAIPAVAGGFAVTVEPEVSSLFAGGYQLPSLPVSGYMTGLPLPWIQLPTYERLIERIDRVGYRIDPVLKGKGIPVWAIAAYVLDLDLSYEEVMSDWGGEISVDEIKAAMEYYQAHPEEIEQKRKWTPSR